MNLRTRFERFCFKNRDKGIHNLMLYIVIGNAIVSILSLMNGGNILYYLLCFDKTQILQGQVWRLFTYVFTDSGTDLFSLIFLYFFYLLGRHVENSMGTFKFNLYYLCGVLLIDIFAMLLPVNSVSQYIYFQAPYYLHLSMLLTFATMYPDSQFMIMFIIPIKGWIIAIIYLRLVTVDVFNLSFPHFYFPYNLFPLIAIANYLLFMGKDVGNIFRFRKTRARRAARQRGNQSGTIPFPNAQQARKETAPSYTHKCTVCGRTDVSNPELEFRYCSRCNGYYCYCMDHINNHEHID